MEALLNAIEPRSQTEPILGRGDMVENNAGGVVFQVSPWELLDRFLMIGTEGGTYYCDEERHTKLMVDRVVQVVMPHSKEEKQGDDKYSDPQVLKTVKMDGARVMKRVVEVSESGLAPKNDYCIFVMALVFAYGDKKAKDLAERDFNKVIRIGTHLFQFMEYVTKLRGMGTQLRRTIQNWYLGQDINKLALNVTKYRNRHGYTHRDVLRIVHPTPNGPAVDGILQWIAQPEKYHKDERYNTQINYFERAQGLSSDSLAAKFLGEVNKVNGANITHEMIPSEVRGEDTWRQLLENGMGMTALLRNLATLTRLQVLRPMTEEVDRVIEQLTDPDAVRKSRVHPINVLIGKLIYDGGRGVRGTNTWKPIGAINDALEEMMMLAFKELTYIDKRVYIGVDCSGSMACGGLMNIPTFSPMIASAALAVTLAKQCDKVEVQGFADGYENRWSGSAMKDLGITSKTTIDQAVIKCRQLDWGGTDCALPMLDAKRRRIPVDCFIILTDSETWAGDVHPTEALRQYRKEMNLPDTKLITVGMTATEFTIADPKDPKQYDVVGFNANLPKIIENCI